MNTRLEIEEHILGQCLTYESQAYLALDILKPINFQDEFCREVFTVLSEMAGKRPIDPIGVKIRLQERNVKLEMVNTRLLMIYQKNVHCVRYYAMLLLERDIKDKTIAALTAKEKRFSKDERFELAAVVKQCLDHISRPDTDILEGLDNIHAYMLAHLADEAHELTEIVESIPKKVAQIKKASRTSYLMEALQRMVQESSTAANQHHLAILRDAFVTLIHRPTTPEYIAEACGILEKRLYA